jgi:uncharacterized protein YodC (DUF2158 family)
MIKVTDNRVSAEVRSVDLAMGQCMEVTESMYNGAILCRTYDGYVNLRNPQQCWTKSADFKGKRVTVSVHIDA